MRGHSSVRWGLEAGGAYDPGGDAGDDRVSSDVLGDDGARADDGAVADEKNLTALDRIRNPDPDPDRPRPGE